MTWTPPGDGGTRLVLVRHGRTEHSAERRFSGRNDLMLTAAGEAEAAALARRSVQWTGAAAVVSSPLPRAVQTASAIAAALGLSVDVEPGFAEVDFGSWEGLTFGEARRRDPSALDAWLADPQLAAPPDGESFGAATARVAAARDALVAAREGATVVVVSHVTPIKILLRLAIDAPPSALFRIHLDTASVSIVDYTAHGSASVRLVNDTGHLSDPI